MLLQIWSGVLVDVDTTLDLHTEVCPDGGIPPRMRENFHSGIKAYRVLPSDTESQGANTVTERIIARHSRDTISAEESKEADSRKRKHDDEEEDEASKPSTKKGRRRKFIPPTDIDNLRKRPRGPPPSGSDGSGNALVV